MRTLILLWAAVAAALTLWTASVLAGASPVGATPVGATAPQRPQNRPE